MDLELMKLVGPLGVGGILALVIFLFHHRAFMAEREHRTEREAILVQLVQDNTKAIERNAGAIDRNTEATGRLEHAVNNLIDAARWRTERLPR